MAFHPRRSRSTRASSYHSSWALLNCCWINITTPGSRVRSRETPDEVLLTLDGLVLWLARPWEALQAEGQPLTSRPRLGGYNVLTEIIWCKLGLEKKAMELR